MAAGDATASTVTWRSSPSGRVTARGHFHLPLQFPAAEEKDGDEREEGWASGGRRRGGGDVQLGGRAALPKGDYRYRSGSPLM
jgi:hypothetical protein